MHTEITLGIGKKKDITEGNMVQMIDGALAGWQVISGLEDSARKITLENGSSRMNDLK